MKRLALLLTELLLQYFVWRDYLYYWRTYCCNTLCEETSFIIDGLIVAILVQSISLIFSGEMRAALSLAFSWHLNPSSWDGNEERFRGEKHRHFSCVRHNQKTFTLNEKFESIFTAHEVAVTRTAASGLWLPLFSEVWRFSFNWADAFCFTFDSWFYWSSKEH